MVLFCFFQAIKLVSKNFQGLSKARGALSLCVGRLSVRNQKTGQPLHIVVPLSLGLKARACQPLRAGKWRRVAHYRGNCDPLLENDLDPSSVVFTCFPHLGEESLVLSSYSIPGPSCMLEMSAFLLRIAFGAIAVVFCLQLFFAQFGC